MARTNQNGSIVGFIIVGVVLTALLVGGIYLFRNTLPGLGQDSEPIAQQDEDADDGQSFEDRVNELRDNKPEEDDTPLRDNETTDEEAATPETTEEPAPTTTDTPLPTAGNEATSEDQPASLPQTGISDILVSGLMLGSLAGLAVHYKRSREIATSL